MRTSNLQFRPPSLLIRLGVACGLIGLLALSLSSGDDLSTAPNHPADLALKMAVGLSGASDQDLRSSAGNVLMNSPLSFEANRGQFDSSITFGARLPGAVIYFGADQALIVQRSARLSDQRAIPMRMRPIGARAEARVEGVEPLRGRVNYLIGNDPRRWVTESPTYARVRYREIYNGIDLVYYGAGRQLEYDWIVAPGASVTQIKTLFDGAKDLRVDESGDLIMRTADTEIRQRRPVAYQEESGRRRSVACRYTIEEINQVGLQVGDYDRTRPLIIDPTLVFATFFGGIADSGNPAYNTGWEDSYTIAVDNAGDIYIAGSTLSRNLPTLNALQPEPSGKGDCVIGEQCMDAFVAKLNQNGLIYSTYIGGSSDEEVYDIAVDAAGAAYITGYTNSARFPVSDGAAQTFNRGFADAFVLKLTPSGSALEYGTYLGGAENDYGFSLAVDKRGHAYVTGVTRSPDFPVNNAFQYRLGGDGFSSDAFVVKLDPSGTGLVYSTYFGGAGSDGGNGIAVDDAGNVYLTGATASPDFPVQSALQRYYVPGYDSDRGGPLPDIFITKFDPNGRDLIFSTYLGSWGPDVGNAIAVDGTGNVYVAGFTGPLSLDNDFPLVNPLPLAHRYFPNPFAATGLVLKLSADGGKLFYSTFLGGVRYADSISDIAVDAAGRIYVIGGATTESGFPLTSDTFDPKPSLFTGDAFLTVLDPAKPGMAALLYSTVYGGSGQETGNALALDPAGNIYFTGQTTIYGNPGPNNLPTIKSLQSYGPIADAYVAKIAPTFDNSADPIPPTITISSPAANTFATTEGTIDLTGMASDNKGVAFVMWNSDRAGVGLAQGADSWNIKQLPLLQGLNRITVTARDAAGNTANATLEVDFQPPYLISIAVGAIEFGLEDIGDGGLAVGAMLSSPSNVLADAAGNLYIADNDHSRIRKVTPDGFISTFVGSGVAGFAGDSGPATAARVSGLKGMAMDAQGNFYFTDYWNYRVRKVTPAGIITTVAGSGDPWPAEPQSSGDGGPATQARLNHPSDVAVDAAGNLYINDSDGFRIRKVDRNGIITTIAGTGIEGDTGDGGPATEARISGAGSLKFDGAGNLYFIVSYGIRRISPDGRISTLQDSNLQPPFAPRALDIDGAGNFYYNETNRVRMRDTAGNFKTIAGRGGEGALGDDPAALAARFLGLQGITLDGKGNIYVVDRHRVLKLSPAMTGDRLAPTVSITAPTTGPSFNSDLPFISLGGVAADDRGVFQVTWRNNRGGVGSALGTNSWQAFSLPLQPGANEITVTARDAEGNTGSDTITINYRLDTIPPRLTITSPTDKNLFETTNSRLSVNGEVSDDVGVAEVRWQIDRGRGGFAEITGRTWRIPVVLLQPGANTLTVTAVDFAGNAAQARLEIVFRPEYLIETYAGRAILRDLDPSPGDLATRNQLRFPRGVAPDAAGNLFIAENQPGLVHKINASGVISLVAGGGGYGDGGDGGPAVDAQLRTPSGVAVDAAGALFIADYSSFKIRKVTPDGKITSYAGTGEYGYDGDGGPATQAKLRNVRGIVTDSAGNLYFADQTSHCVRKISPNGVIITIAGSGVPGFSGDGGPAASAHLNNPTDVVLDAAGNLYITDSMNGRLRKVSPAGVITTIAGNGTYGLGGDGGPATSAQLGAISGVALDAAGNIFLADSGQNRIRRINPAGIITTIAGYDEQGLGIGGFGGDGGPATLAKFQQPADLAIDDFGNIFVADEFNHRIRKLTPYSTNSFPVTSASAASFASNELAVEAITAAFGLSLATRTEPAVSVPLPTTLGGTTVKVRDSQGSERPALLFFVSPNQVNYQIPKGTAPGPATVKVSSGSGMISTGAMTITTVAPSIFTANSTGQGVPSAYVLRIRADGSESYEQVAEFDASQKRFIPRPIDPGPPTDQVFLVVFGTGIRNRSSLANATAQIGGVSAEVLFAGAQGGYVGLDQVNLRLPRSLAGRGEVELMITVDGKIANAVRVNVK